MSNHQGSSPKKPRRESPTRTHIVEVAAAMLQVNSKEHFHIAELAVRADVGVPTVYYYFQSRNELAAYAQVSHYLKLSGVGPSHDSEIDAALAKKDEAAFWAALGDRTQVTWESGGFDGDLGVMRILTDIWADDGARAYFQGILQDRILRWSEVVRAAQALGWIANEIDVEVLVHLLWAASIGHSVLGEVTTTKDFQARLMTSLKTMLNNAKQSSSTGGDLTDETSTTDGDQR